MNTNKITIFSRFILLGIMIVALFASRVGDLAVVVNAKSAADKFNPMDDPMVATGTIRFGVIGDYGDAGQPELDVANLVKSWNPDFIITTGDNNYSSGSASTIDANIGQYYHEFIYPYTGSYGSGATVNRFFPSLGNHDWYATNAQPYLNYFTLPNNERYYHYVKGPVHFFVIDSDSNEPNGNTSNSVQAQWLHAQLAASTSPWNLVYMHHPPYSSGSTHGSTPGMQWPYQAWGADAVLTGHDHTYERIVLNGFPYFVNGLGGTSNIYSFGTPVPGSLVRYKGNYGAMLVEAHATQITFQFITRTGTVIDTYTMNKNEQSLNGGFNTYPTATSKIPTSWKAVKFSTSDGKTTTEKKEGTASVRIAGTSVSKTLSQTLNISGASGDRFTFSFWVKGSAIPTTGDCRAQVFLYSSSVLKQTKTLNCPTSTYGFQKKTIPFNANAAFNKVVIKFTYSKASGTVWFDAVSLAR